MVCDDSVDSAIRRYYHRRGPAAAFNYDYLNGYCDELGRTPKDYGDDEGDDNEQQDT